MTHKKVRHQGQSLLLILALLASCIYPPSTFAEESPYQVPLEIQELKDVAFSTTPTEKRELPEFRTERTKRFQNPDGTFTERLFNQPVHYKDEKEGRWLPIDSTLVSNEVGDFKNKGNKFKVDVKSTANSGFMTVSQNGSSLSVRPAFAQSIKGKVTENKIKYENITKDADLVYTVHPTGVKEDIILKSPDTPSTFSFEMKFEDLSYSQKEDGSISFYKNGQTNSLFTFAKPFMLDANQQISESVSYKIRQDGAGKLWIDVVADPSWLKDAKRSYPVTIDPPMYVFDPADTFVKTFSPDENFSSWLHNLIGNCENHGVARALYKFDLPPIPTGAVISDAKFHVQNDAVYTTNQAPVIDLYPIHSNWSPQTVTWNQAQQLVKGSVASSYTAGTSYGWWAMDITKLTQDWYNGVQPLYGFELRYRDEGLACRELVSSDDPVADYRPFVDINYTTDGLGQQPFWTYDGPVNMANRNLVINETDIDYEGRQVDLTLKRTYNSRSAKTGVFGYGWNSVLDMELSYAERGPARLIDDEGTTHYFHQKADGTFEQLPGLFWNLTVNGATAVITTKDQTRYTFTNRKLTKIQDVAGNALNFYYYSGETVMQDDAGNYIRFLLSVGRVSQAIDVAQRTWWYGYEPNGNLVQVTTPDVHAAYKYRYNNDRNLIATITPVGNATYYSYSSDDRLVAINPVNAVINGNFEVDADGDASPDHFTYSSGQPGFAVDSDSGSPYGKAGKLTVSSSEANNFKVYVSNPIPVDPNKSYTLSSYVKAVESSGAQTSVVSVLAYTADGLYIGELGRASVAGNTDWKRIQATMPAGDPYALPAKAAKVYIKVAASNSGGNGTSWFDGVQFEERNEVVTTTSQPTAFVSGDQYTADIAGMKTARYDGDGIKELYQYNESQNLIEYRQDPNGAYNLTTKYSWSNNTISSNTDPNNGISSFQYDSNGNLLQATDPMGYQIKNVYDNKNNLVQSSGPKVGEQNLYTYDNARNQKTSRNSYHTGAAKGHDSFGHVINETHLTGWADNRINNSDFEWQSTNSDGTPSEFQFRDGQTGTWSLSSDSQFGRKSLKITASTNQAQNYTTITTVPIGVNREQSYMLAGYMKTERVSGTQTSVLSLLAYDNNGALLGEVGRIASQDGNARWQRFAIPIRSSELPAGTSMVRVKLAGKNEGVQSSGSSSFDAIQLYEYLIDSAYNLLDNSSFERGDAGVGQWTRVSGIVQSGVLWPSSPNTFSGGRSVGLQNLSADEGFTPVRNFAYLQDKSYTLSAMVKTQGLTANVAHLKLEHLDTSGKKIGETLSVKLGGDADWKRLSVELKAGQATTGTALIRPVLASGVAAGTVYFDNARLQEERVVSSYYYQPSLYTRMTEKADALNNVTKYQYDWVGNVVSVTSPLQRITQMSYDAMDRLIATTPPTNDSKINRQYDRDGQLTSIEQYASTSSSTPYSTTRFQYHPTGQMKSSTDELLRTRTYSYTPAGRLKSIQYPNTQSVSFAYSAVGQLTNVIYDGTNRYTYGYDANSNIKSFYDSKLGREWNAAYNKNNQLLTWYDGVRSVVFNHDESGNVTYRALKVSKPDTGANEKQQTISYTLSNQPIALTDSTAGTSSFLFNEHNKLSSLQFGNKMTERRQYDSTGRISQVFTQDQNGQTLLSNRYVYDNDGNITNIVGPLEQNFNFTYDANGRILSETLPSGDVASYEYNRAEDPLGSRTKRVVKHPNGTVLSTTSYKYDKANQLIEVNGQPWVYNERGYLVSNGKNNFEWDTAGRLIKVKDQATGETLGSFEYDALGRRIQQTVEGVTTQYLYEGWSNRVIAEYTGGTLTKYFVWGPFDRLLSMTLESITYYPIYNGHGDIVQLRDAGGNLAAWYQYDAWGNITDHSKENNIWSKNPYRYASYRYDDVTGLYYLMARYYDPQVGRFLSPDAIYETPEYAYAGENPITYSDPTGYAWVHSQEGGGGSGRSNSSGGAIGGSTSVGFNGKNVTRSLTEQEQLAADKLYMRQSSTSKVSVERWKVGDDVYKPTPNGEPSWSTVRVRFWKNEAAKPNSVQEYGIDNVQRMQRGLAPRRYSFKKGGWESKELSHEPIPQRDGGRDFVPRWPEEHAKVDPHRRLGY